MIDIDFLNCLIRALFFNLCINYVFIKSTNNIKINRSKWSIMILNDIIVAIVFAILQKNIDLLSTYFISYTLYSLIINLVIKRDFSDIVFITCFSMAFSVIVSFIAAAICYFLFMSLMQLYNADNWIIQGIVELLLIFMFFKVRRFKCGFSFLKETSTIKGITYIGAIIGIVILTTCIALATIDNIIVNRIFVLVLLFLSIILYKWIRKQMKQYLQNEMLSKAIDSLRAEVKEKDEKIASITSDLSHSLSINHNFGHRIAAVELATESAEELTPDLRKTIQNLSQDFKNKYTRSAINVIKIQSTNVHGIDNILAYMSKKAEENNIEINVKINDSITYMVQNIVSESELITMISNHINNSIIAINSSDNKNRRVLVMLGLMNNAYELSIYDTGREFEIETLLALGVKETTTHSTGTGIGFMTSFRSMTETKASLIIEELSPTDNDYTKSVTFRFDKKHEYRIVSYRADEIANKKKDDRIIIDHI